MLLDRAGPLNAMKAPARKKHGRAGKAGAYISHF